MAPKFMVRIVVPRHCSTYNRLVLEKRHFQQEPIISLGSSIATTEQFAENHHFSMHVQCLGERIFWEGFFPLFFQSKADTAIKAISVFIDNEFDVRQQSFTHTEFWNQEELYFHRYHTFPLRPSNPVFHTAFYQSKTNTCLDTCREMNFPSIHLTLILLPPYPSPASSRPLYPERIFTSSLVRWENYLIKLQSINAYMATLGGGYFLCRYLSQAIQLARWQRQVAYALGDMSLASKCTINEAYNFIQANRIRQANVMLRKTKREAQSRNDQLVVSMCDSALWFSHQVAVAHNHPLASKKCKVDVEEPSQYMKPQVSQLQCPEWRVLPIVSKTVDDFLRIRIMQS